MTHAKQNQLSDELNILIYRMAIVKRESFSDKLTERTIISQYPFFRKTEAPLFFCLKP